MPNRHRAFGGQQGRQLRRRPCRDDQRVVQGRAYPSSGTVKDQPSPAARVDRLYPACRSRGELLSSTRRVGRPGL